MMQWQKEAHEELVNSDAFKRWVGDDVNSTVRNNLLTREGYSPYCGNGNCTMHMPRTQFDGLQFECLCGWRSAFPREFIAAYKQRWGIK